ncbi:MAG TPA: ATP-binding protein [Sediminibacterium sp.]|uniref:AAA family ATPase n=1 Tax=Sediminibacterium sp. TaxID=1917865 RepID=UPI0008BE9EE1|nr:ATP-binding protein [Sediminibacterium sp.]OHC85618.1 MAG: AAA family ATPase [Sphingobacteriia bacterium RIFOXYC2_FULL_35_18]OHC89283.1 MAG: AAA family ATPase [Sphingobacteriia bacterium RIFOXYD2_FULL_35_12]HLD52744.1 ATP-binding protein [Sediminibacterium sp.]
MNQALMTRLFKSMTGDKDSPIIRIAHSIIEEERKKGHKGLADKLNSILSEKLEQSYSKHPTLKVTRGAEFKVPVDRRYRLPLASHVEHENLRHHMILSQEIELKIQRIEKEYMARERLAHYGLKSRKKILLHGYSGCGKSMAAERIAWDLGLPFYRVRFDTIISSYLGESASNLQSLFTSISDYPCVLLLDEFDIIGKRRDAKSSDVGEIHRIVNVLLGLLEEYEGEGILIATTNLEDSIDKALFRRFDDFIEFPKPGEREIYDLLRMTFSALKLEKEIDLQLIAKDMIGLSYAIVAKIATDAAKKSILSMKKQIELEDLQKSMEENISLNK